MKRMLNNSWTVLVFILALGCDEVTPQRQEEDLKETDPRGEIHNGAMSGADQHRTHRNGSGKGLQESNLND